MKMDWDHFIYLYIVGDLLHKEENKESKRKKRREKNEKKR